MTSPQTEVADATQTAAQAVPGLSVPSIGFKSSEFATTLGVIAAVGSGHIPTNLVPGVAAVGGVYVACRTLLKAVHALGYAKSIPDLPEIKGVE